MSTLAEAELEVVRLYRAGETPQFVEVPELRFLMIDGHGDPNTSDRFRKAVQALYAVSYTLKFDIKHNGGPAYAVAPLEGLWWADDECAFARHDASAYDWTLMIRQPDAVTQELARESAARVTARKRLAAAGELRLESFTEGRAAQILHVGPYADEGPTIQRLHDFIAEHGYTPRGMHHEIYLGDPRRAAPERLRTILRQPLAASW